MGRISMPQGKGSQMHNRRDYEKIGHKIPDNIDITKSHENVVLVDMELKDAYEMIFGDAVERYNEKQKRDDRKITDYYKKIENSKNGEKLFYEDVIQWGKQDDFENNPELREKAKNALVRYVKDFSIRNPNLKLIGAYIHMDEASPHLHLDYIPVANGYKRGLDTRNSLDKALEQQGIQVKFRSKTIKNKETGEDEEIELAEGRYNNRTMSWKEREREYFGAVCNHYGLEVEEERHLGRKQLTVDEYKAEIAQAEAEAESIRKNANEHFDNMLAHIEAYEGSQKAQIDKEVEIYAQEQKNALEGKLEPLRGKLAVTQAEIIKKEGQIQSLDKQIAEKNQSINQISENFEFISDRVSRYGKEIPSFSIEVETVIDQKGSLFQQEISHEEYFIKLPAGRSSEDGYSKFKEVLDLYVKNYTKESFEELSDFAERKAKLKADEIINNAQDKIDKSEHIISREQFIISQANQKAESIKSQAEQESKSILEKAKDKAMNMIADAEKTLQSLKNKILELTGKRDRLQIEVDEIIDNAYEKANDIIQQAHENAGTQEIYNALNERLGIVSQYDIAEARKTLIKHIEELGNLIDDRDIAMINQGDIDGVYSSIKDKVPSFSDYRPLYLKSALEKYIALKQSPQTPQEVLEDIKESMIAQPTYHRGLSL